MSSVEFRRVNEPWPAEPEPLSTMLRVCPCGNTIRVAASDRPPLKPARMRPMWQIMLIGSGFALAILSPMFVLRFGYWMGWWGL